jgi:hypothetical protein
LLLTMVVGLMPITAALILLGEGLNAGAEHRSM